MQLSSENGPYTLAGIGRYIVSVTTTMVESWIEEEKVAMTSDVFEQRSNLLS